MGRPPVYPQNRAIDVAAQSDSGKVPDREVEAGYRARDLLLESELCAPEHLQGVDRI